MIPLLIAGLLKSPFEKPGGGGQINTDNIRSLEVFPIIIGNIIQDLLIIGGVMAVIMIVWAGISYVVSQGNPDRVKTARSTITYAIVGLIVSSGAYLLVEFVVRRLTT